VRTARLTLGKVTVIVEAPEPDGDAGRLYDELSVAVIGDDEMVSHGGRVAHAIDTRTDRDRLARECAAMEKDVLEERGKSAELAEELAILLRVIGVPSVDKAITAIGLLRTPDAGLTNMGQRYAELREAARKCERGPDGKAPVVQTHERALAVLSTLAVRGDLMDRDDCVQALARKTLEYHQLVDLVFEKSGPGVSERHDHKTIMRMARANMGRTRKAKK
jgi:hypothetical protein